MVRIFGKNLSFISLVFHLHVIRFTVVSFLQETKCFCRHRPQFSDTSSDQRYHQSCRILSTPQYPSGDVTFSDYTQEETLLCISMTLQPGVSVDDALAAISKFCQTFPFAAVLPVQPLFYIPVPDDGGVEIKFMRKKTPERNSNDGGIRFFLRTFADDSDPESDFPSPSIELTAKRNSNGQVITKIMAEKLVITNFVRSFATGDQNTTANFLLQFNKTSPTANFVHIRSMYHKWM
jgi:hypothetical protein